MQLVTLVGEPWRDYALLDSGHGRKLERYGRYRFVRPEGQALWAPAHDDWNADAEFIPGSDEEGGGQWRYARSVPRDGWELSWSDVRFTAQTTPFRHLGFFPDMAPVWSWMRDRVADDLRRLRLAAEPGQIGVRSEIAPQQHLHRHHASQAPLPGPIDDPHAAVPELPNELVVAETVHIIRGVLAVQGQRDQRAIGVHIPQNGKARLTRQRRLREGQASRQGSQERHPADYR